MGIPAISQFPSYSFCFALPVFERLASLGILLSLWCRSQFFPSWWLTFTCQSCLYLYLSPKAFQAADQASEGFSLILPTDSRHSKNEHFTLPYSESFTWVNDTNMYPISKSLSPKLSHPHQRSHLISSSVLTCSEAAFICLTTLFRFKVQNLGYLVSPFKLSGLYN